MSFSRSGPGLYEDEGMPGVASHIVEDNIELVSIYCVVDPS